MSDLNLNMVLIQTWGRNQMCVFSWNSESALTTSSRVKKTRPSSVLVYIHVVFVSRLIISSELSTRL